MAAIGFLPSSSGLSIREFVPSPPQLGLTAGGALLGHAILALAYAKVGDNRTARGLVAFGIFCLCAIIIVNTDRSKTWGGQATMYMFGLILQTNWVLVLKPTAVSPEDPFLTRMQAGIAAGFSPRPVSPSSVLPTSAARFEKTAERIAEKKAFYREKLISIAWTTAVFYLLEHRFRLPLDFADAATTASIPLLQRLTHLNFHDLLPLVYAEALGDFQQYWMLHVIHGTFAILMVSLFDSDPATWPVLYGDIRDAYTMVRFYTHWWHRIMRKQLVENGKMIAQCMIILPAKMRNSRYAVVVMAFLISATMHGIAMSPSLRCLDARCFTYFGLLPLVVMMEETGQSMYHKHIQGGEVPDGKHQEDAAGTKPETHDRRRRTTSKWRFIGYLWVTLYKCWVVPKVISKKRFCF